MASTPLSPRKLSAVLILLAWGASLAWLGIRHYGGPESGDIAAEAALRIAPGDAWFAVTIGDLQVGTASITLDTLSPGFRIQEMVSLTLPSGSDLLRDLSLSRLTLSSSLRLRDLEISRTRAGSTTRFTLHGEGQYLLAGWPPDDIRRVKRPVQPISFPLAVPYQLALSRGMRPGRSLEPLLLDGLPPSARVSMIRVIGDTIVVWPDSVQRRPDGTWETITTTAATGSQLVMAGMSSPVLLAVERGGRVQGMETLFGYRWIRENVDLAGSGLNRVDSAAIDRFRGSLPTVEPLALWPQVATASATSRFLIRRRDGGAIRGELLALLAGGRQYLRGDTLVILAAGEPQSVTDSGGIADRESVDPLLLEPRRTLGQWFDQLNARSGQTLSADSLVILIDQHISIDTSLTATDDAWRTLENGIGSPDGKLHAFLALARQAGIIARPATGLAVRGDSLFTHVWAEVRDQAGNWIAMDPVRGMPRASTALIRLGHGGSTHPRDMLPVIGNARILPLPEAESRP